MADKRTNYFPFVGVDDILKAYDDLQFRDFRNQFTGAALWKAQHPDVETTRTRSTTRRASTARSCHMPKVKDPKTSKIYTSHWQTNPKNYLKETCLHCHTQWTRTQARYVIESMAAHTRARCAKPSSGSSQLVDKFGAGAARPASPRTALKAARAEARRSARATGNGGRPPMARRSTISIWRRSRSRIRRRPRRKASRFWTTRSRPGAAHPPRQRWSRLRAERMRA